MWMVSSTRITTGGSRIDSDGVAAAFQIQRSFEKQVVREVGRISDETTLNGGTGLKVIKVLLKGADGFDSFSDKDALVKIDQAIDFVGLLFEKSEITKKNANEGNTRGIYNGEPIPEDFVVGR